MLIYGIKNVTDVGSDITDRNLKYNNIKIKKISRRKFPLVGRPDRNPYMMFMFSCSSAKLCFTWNREGSKKDYTQDDFSQNGRG